MPNISEYIFKDTFLIKESKHEDERGLTYTIFSEEYNLPVKFVLDKVICGGYACLRGFHGDNYTWKLITCLKGEFILALLDLRPGETLGQTFTINLSEKNRYSVLVPPGVFNAHMGLKDYILHYKWSHPYCLENQHSIRYTCVKWPYSPILSERDQKSPTMEEYFETHRIR